MAKNSPAKTRDAGLIPGLGRSPGEENGNPLQYSCLGNPMNRGAWWATVHGVAKGSDTTEQLNSSNKASVTTYHKLGPLNQHKFILGQSRGQKTKVGYIGLKSRCQQGTLLPGLVTSRSCAGVLASSSVSMFLARPDTWRGQDQDPRWSPLGSGGGEGRHIDWDD